MASIATQTPASQTSQPENLNKTLTLNISGLADKSNNACDDSAAANVDGASGNNKELGESKEETTDIVSSTGNTAAANDIEKKLRRAERFGVPVQLSEQEKRNSRAERFGMGAGSENSKTSEDLKRKARAERFGLSVSADEEAKKKARLTKFGSGTKTDSLGSGTKTDTLEDEKRKARALRFAQPASKIVQHINGEEDVGSNTAIAGNAIEGA